MATLTKSQFKEQLKNPEVASIKRNIHLLRKTIREYDWAIISRNDKKYKCFELTLTPSIYELGNYNLNWDAHHFNDVYEALMEIFGGRVGATVVNDMGDIIDVLLPYDRPKA